MQDYPAVRYRNLQHHLGDVVKIEVSNYPPIVVCFHPDDLRTVMGAENPGAAELTPPEETWHPENPLYEAFCNRRKILRQDRYKSGE